LVYRLLGWVALCYVCATALSFLCKHRLSRCEHAGAPTWSQALGREGAAVLLGDVDDAAGAAAVAALSEDGINARYQHCDVRAKTQVKQSESEAQCSDVVADVNSMLLRRLVC
jgi:hypothetical protein